MVAGLEIEEVQAPPGAEDDPFVADGDSAERQHPVAGLGCAQPLARLGIVGEHRAPPSDPDNAVDDHRSAEDVLTGIGPPAHAAGAGLERDQSAATQRGVERVTGDDRRVVELARHREAPQFAAVGRRIGNQPGVPVGGVDRDFVGDQRRGEFGVELAGPGDLPVQRRIRLGDARRAGIGAGRSPDTRSGAQGARAAGLVPRGHRPEALRVDHAGEQREQEHLQPAVSRHAADPPPRGCALNLRRGPLDEHRGDGAEARQAVVADPALGRHPLLAARAALGKIPRAARLETGDWLLQLRRTPSEGHSSIIDAASLVPPSRRRAATRTPSV